jgi:hypothetical protein
MKDSIRIYDNGGKTFDRYTALDMSRGELRQGMYAAIGFNEAPFHPQGFGQHTSAMPGAHLGRRIDLDVLSPDARRFVEQFAEEE